MKTTKVSSHIREGSVVVEHNRIVNDKRTFVESIKENKSDKDKADTMAAFLSNIEET